MKTEKKSAFGTIVADSEDDHNIGTIGTPQMASIPSCVQPVYTNVLNHIDIQTRRVAVAATESNPPANCSPFHSRHSPSRKMTQISPRNSKSKTSVKLSVRAMLGLLYLGIFFLAAVVLVSTTTTSSKGMSSSFRKVSSAAKSVTNLALHHHHPPSGSSLESFDWSDFSLTRDVEGKCGADKCFWSSNSNPETVGYLVASAHHHFDRMKKAYEFAVDVLEGKCHAKHLFLEPPVKVRVSSKFVRKLNSLKHNDQATFAKKSKGLHHNVFVKDEEYVVVQKVTVAPKPNLMFGLMAFKYEMMVAKDIPAFRSELIARGIDLRQLEEKLESERKGIECAMQHSNTYFYDQQGLIDLEGNYFHMDIDSQFWAEIGDPESSEDDDVLTVNTAQAYKRRQTLILKFNEMIQRLVDPPPEGVDELGPDLGRGKPGHKGHSSEDGGGSDDY